MDNNLIRSWIDSTVDLLPDHLKEPKRKELENTIARTIADDATEDDILGHLDTLGTPWHAASKMLRDAKPLMSPILHEPYGLTLKTVIVIHGVAALALSIFEGFMRAPLNSVSSALFTVLAGAISQVVAAVLIAFALVTATYVATDAIAQRVTPGRWRMTMRELTPIDRDVIFARITATIALGGGLVILIMTKVRTLGWYDGGKMTARLLNSDVIMPLIPLLMLAFVLSVVPDIMKSVLGGLSDRLAVLDIVATVVSLVIVVVTIHRSDLVNTQFLAYVANHRSVHITVVIRQMTIAIWLASVVAFVLSGLRIWRSVRHLRA